MKLQQKHKALSFLRVTLVAIPKRFISVFTCILMLGSTLVLGPVACEKCDRKFPFCSPGGFPIQMVSGDSVTLRTGVYQIELDADFGDLVEVECTLSGIPTPPDDPCKVLHSEGNWQIYAYPDCSEDGCHSIELTIYRERQTSAGHPIYEGPIHLEVLVNMEGMREVVGDGIYDPKYIRNKYGDDEACGWCDQVDPPLSHATMMIHYEDAGSWRGDSNSKRVK